MSLYNLPHFKTIETEEVDELYQSTMEYNKTEIPIEIHFEAINATVNDLNKIKIFLTKLSIFDEIALDDIKDDFHNCDTITEYIDFLLEDLELTDLKSLIDSNHKHIKEQLLHKIHLIGLQFYPEKTNQFVVFNYSVGTSYTSAHIEVHFNDKGEVTYMTIE
jgi:hypothetical protein